MRLPRDLSGRDLVKRLKRHYGYRVAGTKGSHMTATRTADAGRHSVTVPVQRELRLGTLDAIVTDVAAHLGVPKRVVRVGEIGHGSRRGDPRLPPGDDQCDACG